MGGLRRRFVRFRRWIRRPGIVGLATASLAFHLALMGFLGWLEDSQLIAPPPAFTTLMPMSFLPRVAPEVASITTK